MLFIKNDSNVEVDKLNELLCKFKLDDLELDIDSIKYDINRLKNKSVKGISRENFFNLKNTLDYLNKLLGIAQVSMVKPVDLVFSYRDLNIHSRPFLTKSIPSLDIDTFDYFKINDKNVIKVSYESLMNALAFEVAHYDIGFEIEDIENSFKELGLLGIHKQDQFYKVMEEDITYKVLSGFKVSKSPHLTPDKRYFYSYFNDKLKNETSYYREVIDCSLNKAMAIILNYVLGQLVNVCNNEEQDKSVAIAGIYEDSFVILVDKCVNIDNILEILTESLVIRLFTRNFEFHPQVEKLELE